MEPFLTAGHWPGPVAAATGIHQDSFQGAKTLSPGNWAGLLHRITEWFGLKGTYLKDHLVPTPAAKGKETMS